MTWSYGTRVLFLIVLAVSTLSAPALSQEIRLLPGESLPILKNVEFKATVRLAASGVYTYAYSLTNPATNTGEIWAIDIDITAPSGGQNVGADGVVNGPRYRRQSSELVLSEIGRPLIPVGLFSPPDWTAGLSIGGTAGWGASDEPFLIHPGKSLSGFQLTSRGLPGIRAVQIDPYFKQTPVDEATDEDVERVDAIEKAIVVTQQTIGPTAPPAVFITLEFITYLEDLKHQAQGIGWITNDGVVKSLDVKLDQVRKHLQAGSTKTAGNVLQAFMNEVSAQGCATHEVCPPGKHLTPEASGLLYFNAQYLLDHL